MMWQLVPNFTNFMFNLLKDIVKAYNIFLALENKGIKIFETLWLIQRRQNFLIL